MFEILICNISVINKLFPGLFLEKNGNDDFFPAFIYDNGLRVVPHFLRDS